MTTIKRNAIIMAAGTASRFVPLSTETPKGLLEVKGEILIERQIRQLQEAGISDITIVVGYKAEMFEYLKEKFCVSIVLNVFMEEATQSYYSALYAEGETDEYCLTLDAANNIAEVSVGGHDAWYMIGHVYFSEEFSHVFREILTREYEKVETRQGYWEDVYIRFINELPKMQIHRYKEHDIEEFDSIDELRLFDDSYISNTRSSVVKAIAQELNCSEVELRQFKRIKHEGDYLLFTFRKGNDTYQYNQSENKITRM